ncbi:MAG: DUF938 domain-containing protein [Pseudomonadota bacterium]
MRTKPYSQACVNNRDPILAVIRELFKDTDIVLEIGSGTGQHAVYFAAAMPWLKWQTSDLKMHHEGISAWIEDSGASNVLPPIQLDVDMPVWPVASAGGVFSANTAHIISWESLKSFFRGASRVLEKRAFLTLYGPFNYNNEYTSKSNREFDRWLKSKDPASGIRNWEDICRVAEFEKLTFVEDYEMPANNRLLVWTHAR